MMKNKMTRAIGLSVFAAGFAAGSVQAADTVTSTATVQVLSTINIVETTALSFGTIAAFGDDTVAAETATLTLPADGSATSVALSATAADANIVEIVAGTPATYTISGAAPNTVISITLPTTETLTDPSATSANTFTVDTWTKSIVTSGTAFVYDTNATGDLVFNVGANLVTTAVGLTSTAVGEAYEDATYTSTYDVTVSY